MLTPEPRKPPSTWRGAVDSRFPDAKTPASRMLNGSAPRPPEMSAPDPHTITRLLNEAQAGEESAVSALMPLVYDELGSLASRLLASERVGHTLQPTALIHEAWMKLAGHLDGVDDRRHFYALASRAMRQVLTDHARALQTQKRGARRPRVTLDDHLGGETTGGLDLVELDDLLDQLTRANPRHGRVVELRVFGGLTLTEAAESLGVSGATVERDWFMAKAWLRTKLVALR